MCPNIGQRKILSRYGEWATCSTNGGKSGYRRDFQSLGVCQRVDQFLPVGRAPAGAQIVAGQRIEFVGTTAPGIIAGCDVVEASGVIWACPNRINGRVEKAHGWFTSGSCLLVN